MTKRKLLIGLTALGLMVGTQPGIAKQPVVYHDPITTEPMPDPVKSIDVSHDVSHDIFPAITHVGRDTYCTPEPCKDDARLDITFKVMNDGDVRMVAKDVAAFVRGAVQWQMEHGRPFYLISFNDVDGTVWAMFRYDDLKNVDWAKISDYALIHRAAYLFGGRALAILPKG